MSRADAPQGTGRSRADDLLAAALAAGATIQEAAELAGVSSRTVDRRLANPEFRARVEEIKGGLVGNITDRLTGQALGAVEVLVELFDNSIPRIRLQSAKAILDATLKYREANQLEERIRALEQAIAKETHI